MLAKQTITFIGKFFYLEWNPERSVSDIFLFQTGINKQPVNKHGRKKERQDSFVIEKRNILTFWKSRTPGESLVANKCCRSPEYLKGDFPLFRHEDGLHRRDDRLRCHGDRLHSAWSRQLTVMATVFVVKNRAPHGRNPFFADEEPEFTAIPKECALLLTKQYHTITPFPDQDKKDDSCLTVRSVAGKEAKTGHKVPPTWQINICRISGKVSCRPGAAPLPHPGLRGGHTRISSGFASCFWQKKSLSWWKKKPF